jgi:Xaa-Pro aminopeptidase
VWGADKPQRPDEKVFVHDIKYAGEAVLDKYKRVSAKLGPSVDALLVTTLDDIAWFLNLRGSDIPFNPVFFSYLIYINPTHGEASGRV